MPDPKLKAQLSQYRCLIVDDSAAIRSLLQAMLSDLGVQDIALADNGLSALKELKQQPFDIVLSDLCMPGMDGVELLRTLANMQPGLAVIPISSLDARLRFGVSRMAEESGLRVLGILPKPFPPGELERALAEFANTSASGANNSLNMSEIELTDALSEHRIELLYQPQVRLVDGELVGVEALVRIRDHNQELISPQAFIGMSESSGQIVQLTHQIIQAGLGQLGRWNRQGQTFGLSLNISAICLQRLDLPEHVEAIARSHGLSADRINIELTESSITTGAEIYDVMTRFRMRGFGLSLDDYGTGESSLTRLRSLPFTELKLDQSFVRGCDQNSEQATIIRSSISLAHDLGMLVVAEGIQQQSEWNMLEDMGCDVAQGFLVSKPLAADHVPGWSSRWKKLCRDAASASPH